MASIRYLVDAVDLGHNEKGISRVLKSLAPKLVERSSDEILFVCTAEGSDLLEVPAGRVRVVRMGLKSKWEQWDLPRLAARLRVDAVYSHREAGALWGPPLVLHVPEDPEVRWRRDPPASVRDRARHIYSRALLGRSMHRSAVVGASTPAVADQLSARYRIARQLVRVLPLGVDLGLFRPTDRPTRDFVFHLGSSDPRDLTVLVLEAWARANQTDSPLPRLVIGGDLGVGEPLVRGRAVALGIDIELTGRLNDADLAAHFANAGVVIQPSSDEGFGLQPLEAMAAGAPVVVTAAPAVVDVVGDAALICVNDSEAIAEGMLQALASADEFRPRARRRAEVYGWDASADAVLDALAAAAGTRRR